MSLRYHGPMRVALVLLALALPACTQTPSDLPLCVDPANPCAADDAGTDGDAPADAPDAVTATDAGD
jgi:hypothetical protein